MTTRISVSLSWDDAFDADETRSMMRQIGADQIACLQGPGPALTDVLNTIDDDRIELVGWSSHDGPVPLSWLRRVAGQWVRHHEDVPVVVHAGVVRPGQELSDEWRTVTGEEAPLHSPAWQDFPTFRHHLFTCRGPRCNAAGAADLHARLQEKLAQSHALDTDVLITVTGCMYPCNSAPLIVVWPDGRCIQLTEDNLDRVAAELAGPSRQ
ncbi:(2Fe-2S) ferredoxin domain-containing protein [Cutibacterium equinum]|uniref:(2Fe-2S) ferredoxin domain-containing protein n=1 Tax=Cutibacterium equinum TaxID=3016342 RepID=A0ABY7QZM3_9ACTN|nr:(2Fe-2S) ferredoxin domain-containing protein [Cutibacterium equinum]WCC80500.1 (2Fe-2S) ferredoxin domain-containing protein [Cutibacterium equinum]